MDDFVLSNLQESRNEWCARLLTILTPLIIEGLKSIFDESVNICRQNGEIEKYNFIGKLLYYLYIKL